LQGSDDLRFSEVAAHLKNFEYSNASGYFFLVLKWQWQRLKTTLKVVVTLSSLSRHSLVSSTLFQPAPHLFDTCISVPVLFLYPATFLPL
jgi:hypothetical protein